MNIMELRKEKQGKDPHHLILFYDNELLLAQTDQHFHLPTLQDLVGFQDLNHFHELGLFHNRFCYCGEITSTNFPEHLKLYPLREGFSLLDELWFPVIARAIETINWDKHHQFCGNCGHQTFHVAHTFERHCPNCKMIFFPRISPAIIVRICKDDEILLARNAHFTPGIFGLIAGYVAPGESAEEAVIREVREEVSLEIKNLRYYGSQTWPFPDALMLAFTADWDSGEIQIDNHEISEANWYTRENFPTWHSKTRSIARKLIFDFLNDKK